MFLNSFNREYRIISHEKIPSAIASSNLMKLTQRLISNAPNILLAKNQIIRKSIMREIENDAGRKDELLDSMIALGIPNDEVAAISEKFNLLIENLNQLNNISNNLIELTTEVSHVVGRLRLLMGSSVLKVEQLRKRERRIYMETISYLERQIDILLSIQFEEDKEKIHNLENGFVAIMLKTDEKLRYLPYAEKELLRGMKKEIDYYGKGKRDSFAGRLKQLALQDEIEENLIQNRFLSAELAKDVDSLFSAIAKNVEGQHEEFDRQIYLLSMAMLLIPIITFLVAIAIHIYVRLSIISRILKLKECMVAQTEGRDIPIPIVGNDEITSMAKSVSYFINKRNEYEGVLRQARKNADAANRAKSEFIANMSHEIRTPMNVILGFTEIMKGKITDPKLSHYLDSILSSGKSLLSLINDILDLSKVEAGKMKLEYNAVSPGRLFNEMRTVFGRQIADKGLDFIIDIPSDIDNLILLDEARVRQILINLIGNAVKFTDSGYIRLSLSCVYPKHESNTLDFIFSVEDTGKGIPEDQKESIFAAFSQTKGQKHAKYGGSGLGLTITRHLIEMMDGEISVSSEEGKGSTFNIILHGVEIIAADVTEARIEKNIQPPSIEFEKSTILIVDDIDFNRELIKGFLEGYDLILLDAKNGMEAIEKASEHHPQLILMDMKMPEMDGYEASSILKNDTELKNIPVIAVTASAMKSDEEIITTLCDGYIRKPVGKTELISTIMNFLPYHEAGEESMHPENLDEEENPMILPPEDEMKTLNDLAMRGDMEEILNYAANLEKLDGKYVLFARKVRELAEGYDDVQLLELIKRYLEKKNERNS